MAQKKPTKEHGTHYFVKTWINSSGAHVGLLEGKGVRIGDIEGSGFLHFSGLPIGYKSELTDVIQAGPERDAAVEWWENRGKIKEEDIKKKIVYLDFEGNLKFEGGEDVKTVGDIINNTLPGAVQEAFLKEFHKKQAQEEKSKLRESSRVGLATKKLKAEALTKDAVD